jgi:NADH-quinone oxidoreductase subunit N
MDGMNLHLMLPEIYLTLLGLVILVADLYTSPERRFRLGWWAAGGLTVLAVWLFLTETPKITSFAAFGLYRVDGFALLMKKIFVMTGILVSVMSVGYLKHYGRGPGEFFSVVIFALIGMFMVASVNDFMSLFVSLELVTLSFFILAAYRRHDKLSGEAGIKYIIIGAMAAGLMLFGMSFIYGATGEVRFMHQVVNPDGTSQMMFLSDTVAGLSGEWQMTALFGFTLLLVGLGFKVAAVPFHTWVPDVYQGAPTPVTAFLSVGSKAAGFVLIVRVITLVVPTVFPDVDTAMVSQLTSLFALIAGLTLFYGNLAAIPQRNIKRLMGFSSIGHAGYLLLGVVAVLAMKASGENTMTGVSAIAFYLFAYVFTNMAMFIGIVIFSAGTENSHQIDDYAGLGKRAPLLALCLTIALLSLAGVPPLAGFFGKFYLISSVVEASRLDGFGGLLVLAAVGAVNVVVSMYYYLCVVKRMYMMEPTSDEPISMASPVKIALLACVVMIVVIGIFQGPFVTMAKSVTDTLGM